MIRSMTTKRNFITRKWNLARRHRRRLYRIETWPVRRTKVKDARPIRWSLFVRFILILNARARLHKKSLTLFFLLPSLQYIDPEYQKTLIIPRPGACPMNIPSTSCNNTAASWPFTSLNGQVCYYYSPKCCVAVSTPLFLSLSLSLQNLIIICIINISFLTCRNRSKWCIRIWVDRGSQAAQWEKCAVRRKNVVKCMAWNTVKNGVLSANGRKRAPDLSAPLKMRNWRNEKHFLIANADNLHQYANCQNYNFFLYFNYHYYYYYFLFFMIR